MNEMDDGIWYRGKADTFALSSTIPVDLAFLAQARGMAVPEITHLVFEISGTVNSAAGNDAAGFDALKLIDRIRFLDAGGPVIDASGESLRLNEMIELGASQVDMTTLAAGAADAARTWYLVVPFELDKSERPRDTRVPLYHFLAGAELTVACAAALPTGWDGFTGATITLYVRVAEGRRNEVHSRLVIWDRVLDRQEDHFTINGSARYIVGTSKLTTTSASSWASVTSLNSRTTLWPANFKPDILRRQYRIETMRLNANDPIVAATPLACPFVFPYREQKIGAMIDAEKFHLDLGTAPPTSARLLTSIIKDRDPALAAAVMGFTDQGAYLQHLKANGEVVSAKGSNKPVTMFDPKIANRLPLRLKSGVVG